MSFNLTGFIELITESETLRKIQVSSGLTGSFKDRPIKDWLQRHNPTELEYQKVHCLVLLCYFFFVYIKNFKPWNSFYKIFITLSTFND